METMFIGENSISTGERCSLSGSRVRFSLALTALAVAFAGQARVAAAEALDTSQWQRSLELRVSGYRGASALADFPLFVALDPAALAGFRYGEFAPQGADLRFTDADNTAVLSHEIEVWDTNGVSRVWVRVPSLVSNQAVRAFWRNPEAGAPAAASVWDAGFRGVWHLSGTLNDATTNANNGSNTGSVATNGMIAGARAFDGNDFIDCGNGASLNVTNNQLTLSAWIKPNAISGNAIIGKSYAATHSDPYYSWVLYTVNAGLHCRIDTTSGTKGTLTLGQWQHVSVAYNGSLATFYLDGVSVGSFNKTGTLWLTPRNVRIGGRDTSPLGEYFNGSIDEVRVSSVARSADWVRAERDTVANAAFCTFGSVTETWLPQVSGGVGATNVLASTACLTGELTSTGRAPATVWVCWGAGDSGTNFAAWAQKASLGVRSPGAFSSSVYGLAPESPYVYRCRAVNAYGESWSAARAFTPLYPRLSVVDAQALEGHAGTSGLLFRVSLSYAAPEPVTFHYVSAYGAASACDFQAVSGELTLESGQSDVHITVPVYGDTQEEPDEGFTVEVSAVTGAIISKARAFGLILDDDRTNSLSPCALAADAVRGRLYVARQTDASVGVLDTAANRLIQAFALQAAPNGLALSPDGTRLYVAAGGADGQVCVLDTAEGAVLQTYATGHTPLSPVVSPDGNTLYVCNRFNDDVSVIRTSDGATLARVAVGREPHAAALTPDGARLFVAELLPAGTSTNPAVAAAVSVVDTATRTLARRIPLPPGAQSLRGLCVSADGANVYVAHVLSRFYAPTTQVLRGWMNTAALSVIDVASETLVNTVLLDDLDLGAANPWDVACTADNRYVCVSHAGTHEVSVLDQAALLAKLQTADEDTPQDLTFLVGVRRRLPLKGNGPRGVALLGGTLYAAEYFSDTVGAVSLAPGAECGASAIAAGAPRPSDPVRLGERHFNDATLCLQRWQSCASCHPDARADALNWDLMNDGFGTPKNTKSMLYAIQTPPAMSTGIRAHARLAVRAGLKYIQFVSQPESLASEIDAYLAALRPEPSPRLANGALSAAAARGAAHFQGRGCAGCHSGAYLTDGLLHDIGTATPLESGVLFDTPALRELWRTGPYLHDGRYATVREVVTMAHASRVSGLTPEEVDDLVEYLLSL
jgi:YVTN family beta-propeller protein